MAFCPFTVHETARNVTLHFTGYTRDGQAQPMERVIGPRQKIAGAFRDALGDAILELIDYAQALEKENAELQEMLAAEPSDRRRKRKPGGNHQLAEGS